MADKENSSTSQRGNKPPLTTSPWVRAALWIVGTVLVLSLCVWLSDIVIPLLLAILVAYVFDPVVGWFEERRFPRTLAIVVVILALVAAVVLVVVTIAVTSVEDAARVAQSVEVFKQKVAGGGSKLRTDVAEWIKESNYSDRIVEILRQILVSLTLTVIYALGLSLLNVPFALIIAIIGGFANIVPYMGLVLGLLPAVLLAIVAFGDLWHPAGAVGVFIIGQTLEGTVLTPRIVGRSTNLHPVTVILSILVFARLLGFVGLLIAVPAAAVIKVLAGEAVRSYQSVETPRPANQRRTNRRRPRRRRRPSSRTDASQPNSKPPPNPQSNRNTGRT